MTFKEWITYIATVIIINWKWLKYVLILALILIIF